MYSAISLREVTICCILESVPMCIKFRRNGKECTRLDSIKVRCDFNAIPVR